MSRPGPAGPTAAATPSGRIPSRRAGLEAIVADSLTEPAPAGWDEFVEAERLHPVWHSHLIGSVDWTARSPSTLVLVREMGSGQPAALFHARHVGLGRPGRFARPGRVPAMGMTMCAVSPAFTPGFGFAAALDRSDRTEACRVFERALRRRTGWGHPAFAYRHLYDQDLPVVPAGRRTRIRQATHMVVENAWPDVGSYLASLPGKWRSQLRRIRGTVDDSGLRVEVAEAVEPDQVSWLVEVVRARYRSGGINRPPWPPALFAALGRSPAGRFLTYRTEQGRLVGCTIFIDDGEELAIMLWGARGSRDGAHRDLYFDQYLRIAELMVRTGRTRLRLGFGMNAIKARYGAQPERRWTVVGLR